MDFLNKDIFFCEWLGNCFSYILLSLNKNEIEIVRPYSCSNCSDKSYEKVQIHITLKCRCITALDK